MTVARNDWKLCKTTNVHKEQTVILISLLKIHYPLRYRSSVHSSEELGIFIKWKCKLEEVKVPETKMKHWSAKPSAYLMEWFIDRKLLWWKFIVHINYCGVDCVLLIVIIIWLFFLQVKQLLNNALSSGQQIFPCVVGQILEGIYSLVLFSLQGVMSVHLQIVRLMRMNHVVRQSLTFVLKYQTVREWVLKLLRRSLENCFMRYHDWEFSYNLWQTISPYVRWTCSMALP